MGFCLLLHVVFFPPALCFPSKHWCGILTANVCVSTSLWESKCKVKVSDVVKGWMETEGCRSTGKAIFFFGILLMYPLHFSV
ncbi:hypothetical protein TRSC58_07448 [Trypanosoma rangeli SC58]|uniref:Secreted protein n=1 Tax=Trypanosoma rangeli SC58 TaxID=429131 RepID=A0A061IRL8_TRYRA|nr:hypothetical protein TRSC58_07448 [Trypanosoma rangeli SC58]